MTVSTRFHPAATVPVSLWALVLTAIRAIYVNFFKDNPFLFAWRHGAWNSQADIEGPAYIVHPPDRQLEGQDGKAVLATEKHLQEWTVFLLKGSVVDPSGAPVAGAHVAFWQADPTGAYAVRTYDLRGKFRTAQDGSFEVLTVWPAPYGVKGFQRASHFHLMITPPAGGKRYMELTTQLYVCPNNDARAMNTDFVRFIRSARTSLMLQTYAVPPAADPTKAPPPSEMPALPTFAPEYDPKLARAIREWNSRLEEGGKGKQVGAAARMELRLNVV